MSTEARQDVTTTVGNTPLVKLQRVVAAEGANVFAKLECFNPCGSVKDRVAVALIDNAEASGKVNSETIFVEPTSGNTGIGLAMVCAARGYKLEIVLPASMSLERRQLIASLGAELVLTDAESGMGGAIAYAEQKVAEDPRYILADQFCNCANPAVHTETTGPEIWEQTEGQIDIFVAGVGTGGTFTGVSQFLGKHKSVECVAVEPAASPVITQSLAGEPLQPAPHKIQGMGAGFIPSNLDTSLIDKVVTVEDEEALTMTRRLACEEGIFAGISSGAAAVAATKLAAAKENKGKNIVVVFPDAGDRYLSTGVFNI